MLRESPQYVPPLENDTRVGSLRSKELNKNEVITQ